MSDEWRYRPVPDLGRTPVERLKDFPRQPDMLVYAGRTAGRLSLALWMRLYHRLQIDGREHLPADESFVMVGNLVSHLDAMSMIAATPFRRRHSVFPAAAADYFFTNLPRTAVSAVMVNALPFDRQEKTEESLALCRRLMERPGRTLILFPEGTRSLTGEMGRFRSGIGRLVVGTETPVVPCRLIGCERAWPKGAAWPRPRKIRIRIGPPRRYGHLEDSRGSVETICRDLEEAVRAL